MQFVTNILHFVIKAEFENHNIKPPALTVAKIMNCVANSI